VKPNSVIIFGVIVEIWSESPLISEILSSPQEKIINKINRKILNFLNIIRFYSWIRIQ